MEYAQYKLVVNLIESSHYEIAPYTLDYTLEASKCLADLIEYLSNNGISGTDAHIEIVESLIMLGATREQAASILTEAVTESILNGDSEMEDSYWLDSDQDDDMSTFDSESDQDSNIDVTMNDYYSDGFPEDDTTDDEILDSYINEQIIPEEHERKGKYPRMKSRRMLPRRIKVSNRVSKSTVLPHTFDIEPVRLYPPNRPITFYDSLLSHSKLSIQDKYFIINKYYNQSEKELLHDMIKYYPNEFNQYGVQRYVTGELIHSSDLAEYYIDDFRCKY